MKVVFRKELLFTSRFISELYKSKLSEIKWQKPFIPFSPSSSEKVRILFNVSSLLFSDKSYKYLFDASKNYKYDNTISESSLTGFDISISVLPFLILNLISIF